MSKHLKRGCPLKIEHIAKYRRSKREEALRLDFFSSLDVKTRREVVTQRVLLWMEKNRYRTTLDEHIEELPE